MNFTDLTNSKHVKAIRLRNSIIEYLNEEEFGELINASNTDKKRLRVCIKALEHVIKYGKTT